MARRREPKFVLYFFDGDFRWRDRIDPHHHDQAGHFTKASALKGLKGLLAKLSPVGSDGSVRLEERGRLGTYQLASYHAEPKGSGFVWVGGPLSASIAAPKRGNAEPPHLVQLLDARNAYGTPTPSDSRRFLTEAQAKAQLAAWLSRPPKAVDDGITWSVRERDARGVVRQAPLASYRAIDRKGRRVWDWEPTSKIAFQPDVAPARWTQKKRETERVYKIRLKPHARDHVIDVLVDGKKVDTTPAGDRGGAALRSMRAIVAELRKQHPGARFDLPGGLRDEKQIVRDATRLFDRKTPMPTVSPKLLVTGDRLGPYRVSDPILVRTEKSPTGGWEIPVVYRAKSGQRPDGWFLIDEDQHMVGSISRVRGGGWIAREVGSVRPDGGRNASIRLVASAKTPLATANAYARMRADLKAGKLPPRPEKAAKKKAGTKKSRKKTDAQRARVAALRGDVREVRKRQTAARKKAVQVCKSQRQRLRAEIKKYREQERTRINVEVAAMRKAARDLCAARKARIKASSASTVTKARARLQVERELQRKLAGINDRAKKKRARVQAFK